jgi:hypothetical protein
MDVGELLVAEAVEQRQGSQLAGSHQTVAR